MATVNDPNEANDNMLTDECNNIAGTSSLRIESNDSFLPTTKIPQSSFSLPYMPIFSFSSGVQISGGNFYEIAGDIQLPSAPLPGPDSGPRMALSLGSTQSANRLLSGPQRRDRDARRLPYAHYEVLLAFTIHIRMRRGLLRLPPRITITGEILWIIIHSRPILLSTQIWLSWTPPRDNPPHDPRTSISASPLSSSLSDPSLYLFSPPGVEFPQSSFLHPLRSQDSYNASSRHVYTNLHDLDPLPTVEDPSIEYPSGFDPRLDNSGAGESVETLTSAMDYGSQYMSGESSQDFPDDRGLSLPNPSAVIPCHDYPTSQPQSQFWGLFDSSSTIDDSQDPRAASHGGLYPESTNRLPLPGDMTEPPFGVDVAPINYLGFLGQQSQQVTQAIINDGNFIAAGNVNNIAGNLNNRNVNNIQGESGFHILHRAAANNASHDAGDRYPQPRCHPETRTDILAALHNWSSEEDPKSRIFWLYGPAGAGKSAITQSFCQKRATQRRLGGSFFFKRGHLSRGRAMKLFPTIAYHLAVALPEFKVAVVKRVEEDPSIFDKSLSIQLQELIVEPFRDITPARTFVVVIDGLDECEGDHVQQHILHLIGNAALQSQLPIRFLIASRPEPHIREVFREPFFDGFHQAMNIEESFHDVRTYLRDEFARIHREHHETMGTVASPWPSHDVVEHLVEKSSGYFIYASTVIKFIDDKRFRPTKSLKIIMGIAEPEFESPFSELDQLYHQILAAIPPRPQLHRILSVVAVGLSLSIPHIEQLLQLKPGDVQLTLRGLHSVINIPHRLSFNDPDDPDTLVAHHASFLDFLNDPKRSRTLHVADIQRQALACDILRAFSYTHDNPSVNAGRSHVAWSLDLASITTFAQPSPDLIPLFHQLNPDFLFLGADGDLIWSGDMEEILEWLKKAQPSPADLIQLWEDYIFMLWCDEVWTLGGKTMGGTANAAELQDTHRVVSQVSPQLIGVLQAYPLLYSSTALAQLFDIRAILNYSWDELRTFICPLRGITAHHTRIRALFPDSTLHDLAAGSMQLIKKIGSHELPREFYPSTFSWSCVLRACPPCPCLLQSLHEAQCTSFSDPDLYKELHNVIQWLKTFPQPPLDFGHCGRAGWPRCGMWTQL
ncbi:hypothetical protein C8R44DRAFT_861333 [Mycena epipterygia]|nr:hypothetical protein C8R44DRAFT_861333 [Mycena epipterygia]